jgi:cytoskeleton protein RodZ
MNFFDCEGEWVYCELENPSARCFSESPNPVWEDGTPAAPRQRDNAGGGRWRFPGAHETGKDDWASMGSFGEDLRMERLSRGIALEQITAVTKISQRHLLALEQERFRLLPGGILTKGIVRGYVGALGLDQTEWMKRFQRASAAAGEDGVDDQGWAAFAANVGKARIQRHDALEFRLRWIGAILLLLLVGAGVYLAVRYLGVRAGWWPTLVPEQGWPHEAILAAESVVSRALAWLKG